MYVSRNLLTLLASWTPALLCLATETPSFPSSERVEYITNQFIIQYKSTDEANELKESITASSDEGITLVREIPSRNIQVVTFPSSESAESWLGNAKEGVEHFERDSMMYLDTLSTTGLQNRNLEEQTPYGITYVKALDVSDEFAGERKVCIIDSGYDMAHPDLPDDTTLFTGESFVSGYEWDTDENSHGTHVAGTIVALKDNGQGVVGVIRNGLSKMHISKVFDASGSTSTSNVIAGFQSCVDGGSNVINMSLGGGGYTQSFQDAINDAESAGVLTFASSGNSYGTAYNYPASYDYVMSVASITDQYVRSAFSTYNDLVDVCAPGSNVLSTVPGGGYSSYSGTSMACPHAVGVAALVWSHYPTVGNDVIRNFLQITAQDLPLNEGDGYDNEYGWGLVNALAALNFFTPTVSPAPTGSPSTSAPTDPCLALDVEITTDDWASETSFDVVNPDGNVVVDMPGGLSDFTEYTFAYCLPPVCDYTFTIYDSYGDGICCGWGAGSYAVTYAGSEVASGGEFDDSESTDFGCVSPTVSPRPSEYVQPCLNLDVQLYTDDWATETSFNVVDPDGNVVVDMPGGDLTDFTEYNYDYCLVPACDYTFTIYDSFGDGMCCAYGDGYYTVTYDGTEVASGGDFDTSESTNFGCVTQPPVPAPPQCTDSPTDFAFNGLGLDCAFVGENLFACDVDALNVKSHCPATCDACNDYGCEDSEVQFVFVKPNGGTVNLSCGIIPTEFEEVLCGFDSVKETCRDLCGFCPT